MERFHALSEIQTRDLTKKGLRLPDIFRFFQHLYSDQRPDEEGIKTRNPVTSPPAVHSDQRPDEEGIKTKAPHMSSKGAHSDQRPDEEGIKTLQP